MGDDARAVMVIWADLFNNWSQFYSFFFNLLLFIGSNRCDLYIRNSLNSVILSCLNYCFMSRLWSRPRFRLRLATPWSFQFASDSRWCCVASAVNFLLDPHQFIQIHISFLLDLLELLHDTTVTHLNRYGSVNCLLETPRRFRNWTFIDASYRRFLLLLLLCVHRLME
jgi:hypothetical protein